MELTKLQQDKVNRILKFFNPEKKVVCQFKAPTGSGKTLMAASFISNMIERHKSEHKFIFVIATPSASELPLAFEQKINKYKKDLPFTDFEVEYIQSPSTTKDKTESTPKIQPKDNKVYIFGKASFGKSKIYTTCGTIEDFVKNVVEHDYKLVYIRDEAHIGDKSSNGSVDKNSVTNFETLMNKSASFVLKMTATPDYKNFSSKIIILNEKDLNNPQKNEGRYLLKTNQQPITKNKDVKDTEILHLAIEQFHKIKQEYASLDLESPIHPAMLIQVDNNSNTDKEKQEKFESTLKEIKHELNKANLSWVQYFGKSDKEYSHLYAKDFNLEDVTDNNSDADVVIFKIGPATGWDIPRACMLVQLRNISSISLNTQTIGRIKRNPYPNLEFNEITDKYYLFTNVKLSSELKNIQYKLQEQFEEEKFLAIKIKNTNELQKKNKPSEQIKQGVGLFLTNKRMSILQCIDKTFVVEDGRRAYKRILMITNEGNEIYSTITNSFAFLRYYKKLVAANKLYYMVIKVAVEEFAKTENIQPEFVFTVLLENSFGFKDGLNKEIKEYQAFEPDYEIVETLYDPKEYQELNNSEIKEKIIEKDYAFVIKDLEEGENDYYQLLDSKNERTIFNKIHFYTKTNDKKVRVWAKNLTVSDVYGEFVDNFNIHRSYFDFIIKFENGMFLYLEVKGAEDRDINSQKTEKLKDAYADYFKKPYNEIGDLFQKRKDLAIAVVRVGDNNNIEHSIYYEKEQFSEDLNIISFEKVLNLLSVKAADYSDFSLEELTPAATANSDYKNGN